SAVDAFGKPETLEERRGRSEPRGRDTLQQLLQLATGEAEVERYIGTTGVGPCEQHDRRRQAVAVQQRGVRVLRRVELRGRRARRLTQCAVAEALRPAAEGGALAEGIRCHVEQHRKVHRL